MLDESLLSSMNYYILYLSVFFVSLILIGIAAFYTIRSTKDFFVAGGTQSAWKVSFSLIATILGSSSILGGVDYATEVGWGGVSFLLSGVIGLVALYPLAPRVRNYAQYTLPEMLRLWFGKEIFRLSSIIIVFAWTGIIAAQIIGAAKILQLMIPLSYTWNVLIASSIIILYTGIGGQYSVIHTDFLQGGFLVLGILGLALWVSFLPSAQVVFIGTSPIANSSWESLHTVDVFILILTYGITFTVGADIYSRLFCTKDGLTARRSIGIAICVLPFIAVALTSIGIYIDAMYPEAPWGSSGALIYFIQDFFPPYISGLMLLVLLSAVLSSADTTLLTASAITTGLFKASLEDPSSIQLSRLWMIIIGLVSTLVALLLPSIIQALLLGLSIFSGACIVPTILGLLGYRFKTRTLLWAISLGGGMAFVGKILEINHWDGIGKGMIIASFVVNMAILSLFPGKHKIKVGHDHKHK